MRLTIGIPVLNGGPHLPNVLKSIFDELSSVLETIEFLIIDNASTDGTSEYLLSVGSSNAIPKNVQLEIVINEKNMGFDHSVENLIKRAKGKYVWLLGAQETLHRGGLATVLANLDKEPWQIVLNCTMRDEATNTLINDNLYARDQDEHYDSPEEFFHVLGGPSLSMSANVSRRIPILKQVELPTFSRYWGWLERYMETAIDPNREGQYIFISTPIVEILIEKGGWQNTGLDTAGTIAVTNANPVYFTFVELTEIAKRKFDARPLIRDSIGAYRDPFGVARSIALAKTAGLTTTWATLRRSTSAFGFTLWYWFLGLPLLIIPSRLYRRNYIKLTRRSVHLLRRIFDVPAK